MAKIIPLPNLKRPRRTKRLTWAELSPDERQFLRDFRRMTPEQREFMYAFGERLWRRARIRDAIARATEVP